MSVAGSCHSLNRNMMKLTFFVGTKAAPAEFVLPWHRPERDPHGFHTGDVSQPQLQTYRGENYWGPTMHDDVCSRLELFVYFPEQSTSAA